MRGPQACLACLSHLVTSFFIRDLLRCGAKLHVVLTKYFAWRFMDVSGHPLACG